ncbi:MAG: hypothetical protein WCO00_01565 [Rhodospirillaceae bacterium]
MIDLGPFDHYLLAVLGLVGTVAAAAVMVWLAHHSRHAEWLHTYRGVAPNFLSVVGVLFALNLVFLANDTWHAHDHALDAVYKEAGALRSIVALANQLPAPVRDRVASSVRSYARYAVEAEWPLLAERRSSAEAAAELDRLLGLLASPEVGKTLDSSVHSLILQQAVQVRTMRDLRVALSQTHVNPLKWLGMAFLGLLMMVSIVMVHVDQAKAELLAVLLFAAAAGPTAAIVLVQGNPFQQPTAVTAAPIAAMAMPLPPVMSR